MGSEVEFGELASEVTRVKTKGKNVGTTDLGGHWRAGLGSDEGQYEGKKCRHDGLRGRDGIAGLGVDLGDDGW